MTPWEEVSADLTIVEHLAEYIARGWIGFIHHSPEDDLEADFIDCDLLRPGNNIALALERAQLRIERFDVNGDPVPGEVWERVRSCPQDSDVHIYGTLAGLDVSLRVCAPRASGVFSACCFFRERNLPPFEPGDEVYWERVTRWCNLIVNCGAALGAQRVEVPGGDIAATVPIWERS